MRLFNFFAIMFLLVGAVAFSSCTGTDTETVTETEYVCSDGSTADSAAECPTPPTPEPVTEYVCADGSTADSAAECPTPEPVTEYVCEDGSTADSAEECPEFFDPIGPGFEVGVGCYDAGSGNNKKMGTDKGDCIRGEGGDDYLKGVGGNDMLDGGAGDDTLDGGAGDDELIGGTGNNLLKGGEGTDIAVYRDALLVEVQLDNNVAGVRHKAAASGSLLKPGDSGTGRDTLMGIENVKGTLRGNDTITGDAKANVLKGLDGADTLNGGAGDDTLLPNRPAENNAANVVDATATDPPEIDGVDVVDGGEGDDTISYEGESATVTIDLSATATPGFIAAVTDDPDTTDTNEADFAHFTATIGSVVDEIKVKNIGTTEEPKLESTIENIMGGFGDDTLTGDVRGNVLSGGGGADVLNGEAAPAAEATTDGGADMLNGGPGGDTLNGGPGADTLMGGAGDDTLNGNAGNDILNGGAGADALDGGTGNDQFIITKGDGGDTIATFAAGDKIVLKGFGGSGNVKLTKTADAIQSENPDDATRTTLVTITAGAPIVRLTSDILYED